MRLPLSLRSRVAVATGLGATIIVAALGVLVSHAIAENNLAQLDRRLEAASSIFVPNAAIAGPFLGAFGDEGAFAVTVRKSDGTIETSTPTQLPELENGAHTVYLEGTAFRTFTATVPRTNYRVSLAVPFAEAQDVTSEQQQQVVFVGILAVAAASVLGWLFGGHAVRPLVDLTRRIAAREPDLTPASSGVREADELADAAESMLRDVAEAQERTTAALATARDFAAVSAHELRTPLTAMRTDIEVLSTLDLTEVQRSEILADLTRAQSRVEATLTDLERLAKGELSTEKDFVDTDLREIADRAARDARRHFPAAHVTVHAEPVTLRGLPAGLRSTIDNAITNAIRHGQADSVEIRLHRAANGVVTILVDDDGTGIPDNERTAVFERFQRGRGVVKSGSGLGLALVAQQAALHGGRTYFTDSPLGGARLVIELDRRT